MDVLASSFTLNCKERKSTRYIQHTAVGSLGFRKRGCQLTRTAFVCLIKSCNWARHDCSVWGWLTYLDSADFQNGLSGFSLFLWSLSSGWLLTHFYGFSHHCSRHAMLRVYGTSGVCCGHRMRSITWHHTAECSQCVLSSIQILGYSRLGLSERNLPFQTCRNYIPVINNHVSSCFMWHSRVQTSSRHCSCCLSSDVTDTSQWVPHQSIYILARITSLPKQCVQSKAYEFLFSSCFIRRSIVAHCSVT